MCLKTINDYYVKRNKRNSKNSHNLVIRLKVVYLCGERTEHPMDPLGEVVC